MGLFTLFLMLFIFVGSIQFHVLDDRIVNGELADYKDFPYIVSLRNKYFRLVCGGSLIRKKIVLTAAQCVLHGKDVTYVIQGTNKLNSGGKRYRVSAVRIHEKFQHGAPNVMENDIALIRLEIEAVYDESLPKINTGLVNEGTACWSAGWGFTVQHPPRFDTRVSNDLKKAKLFTKSDKDCDDEWGRQFKSGQFMCAQSKAEPQDGVCSGDSGGPLICDEQIVGLVSFSRACALGSPDVFTNVSFFDDWIKSNIKSLLN